MKVIQEEGLSLLRNIRLLVDTTEETSSTAIPYYFEKTRFLTLTLPLMAIIQWLSPKKVMAL